VLKERRTLEQDVQIQDLTNRLSEQATCRSATYDLQDQANHVLDAGRVEGLERRLLIQEPLRIQEERMRSQWSSSSLNLPAVWGLITQLIFLGVFF